MRAGELAASTSKKRQDNETIDGAYFLTWISYLQARAKQGDTGALQALRASPQAAAKAAAAFLTAQDETAAKTIILKELNPVVHRGGELSYTLSDGGAITDERRRIRIDKASYQATLVALTLGAERFRGQTLTIAGTGAFKREAVEVAAALNLKISFTDPLMEDERRQMVLTKSGRLPSEALVAFVSDQNKLANTLSSSYRYRPWSASDAGELVYYGRRTFRDGSAAILLRTASEILVKPARP